MNAKRRVRFTAEQDQLLLDHVAEMSVLGKKIKGQAIFQDFAKYVSVFPPTGKQKSTSDNICSFPRIRGRNGEIDT